MENGTFAANAPFFIMFSKILHFESAQKKGLLHKARSTFYSFVLVRLKFNDEGMVLAPFVLLV